MAVDNEPKIGSITPGYWTNSQVKPSKLTMRRTGRMHLQSWLSFYPINISFNSTAIILAPKCLHLWTDSSDSFFMQVGSVLLYIYSCQFSATTMYKKQKIFFSVANRDPLIMLKILPIMLCCTTQNFALLCFQYFILLFPCFAFRFEPHGQTLKKSTYSNRTVRYLIFLLESLTFLLEHIDHFLY